MRGACAITYRNNVLQCSRMREHVTMSAFQLGFMQPLAGQPFGYTPRSTPTRWLAATANRRH